MEPLCEGLCGFRASGGKGMEKRLGSAPLKLAWRDVGCDPAREAGRELAREVGRELLREADWR